MRRRVPIVGLNVVAALTLAACSSSGPALARVTALPSRPAVAAGLLPRKVLVVVEEKHTASSALGGMPYLAALSAAYGHTTHYQAVAHPSLPNYLAIAGGSTFGVSDDEAPSQHPLAGPSVFDAVLNGGGTTKT